MTVTEMANYALKKQDYEKATLSCNLRRLFVRRGACL